MRHVVVENQIWISKNSEHVVISPKTFRKSLCSLIGQFGDAEYWQLCEWSFIGAIDCVAVRVWCHVALAVR